MVKRKRLFVITRRILIFICSVLLFWIIFHHTLTVYEQKKYPAYGEMVDVDGEKMHVYTTGEGEHTIVLLSGLGTPAPMLDFEPLIDELAEDYQVVVLELFGYGWSEKTNRTRSVENIVEEIRIALLKADIDGPYVLMPHSISGIYSMYYANQYPDEVEAVIGIDATLPKAIDYFNETIPKTPTFMKYVSTTGMARLAAYFSPDSVLPIATDGTYSDENLKVTKAITAWKAYNRNVIEETNEIRENIQKTKEFSFPNTMPVLFFSKKDSRISSTGKTTSTFLETQLTESPFSDIVTIDGHHYLHWTHSKEISNEVKRFISSYSR